MNFTKGITLALVFSVTAVTSRAHVTSKKSLTLDGARTVIAAAIAEAKKVNAPGGVIAVVDEGGNLMALERLDGTFAAGANISMRAPPSCSKGPLKHSKTSSKMAVLQ